MSDSWKLTERDVVVLQALSLKVRLFSLRQIADVFWCWHVANARRRLRRLIAAGLVRRDVAPAQPLPEMTGPVFAWQPGDGPPNAEQISFRLKTRWKYRALRPTVVYLPTESTVEHFGGRPHHHQISTQVTHDLGVAAIWLRLHLDAPPLAKAWRGEDLIARERRGETLPDALLVGSDQEPAALIEFGGSYGPTRTAELCDDAAMRNLPCQIW